MFYQITICHHLFLKRYKNGKLQFEKTSRVVQLPGDIDNLQDERQFFANLRNFIEADKPDIVIGDFDTGNFFSTKELIDTYGTYPLLANWFPEVSRKIHSLPLRRPRSEFLNIKTKVLRKMLSKRKFAYEQTLNILINSYDINNDEWKYKINSYSLGKLKDDKTLRRYAGALNQIERTERILKLLWREANEPDEYAGKDSLENYKKFIAEYDRLDRLSTGIRENSRITIRALLDE